MQYWNLIFFRAVIHQGAEETTKRYQQQPPTKPRKASTSSMIDIRSSLDSLIRPYGSRSVTNLSSMGNNGSSAMISTSLPFEEIKTSLKRSRTAPSNHRHKSTGDISELPSQQQILSFGNSNKSSSSFFNRSTTSCKNHSLDIPQQQLIVSSLT